MRKTIEVKFLDSSVGFFTRYRRDILQVVIFGLVLGGILTAAMWLWADSMVKEVEAEQIRYTSIEEFNKPEATEILTVTDRSPSSQEPIIQPAVSYKVLETAQSNLIIVN